MKNSFFSIRTLLSCLDTGIIRIVIISTEITTKGTVTAKHVTAVLREYSTVKLICNAMIAVKTPKTIMIEQISITGTVSTYKTSSELLVRQALNKIV